MLNNNRALFIVGFSTAFIAQVFCWFYSGHFMPWLNLGIIVVTVIVVVGIIDEIMKFKKNDRNPKE